MNTENFVASRNDDVVFDNRNKSYGAYSIRRSYTSSLTKGSGGSLLATGLFIAIVQAALMMKPEIKDILTPHLPVVDLVPPPLVMQEPVPPKEVHSQPKANTSLPPQIVSTPVESPPVEMPGPMTNGTDNGPVIVNAVPGNGVSAAPTPLAVQPPQTLDVAEVMPEFEGGTKAMYKFLQKHLRYPRADQRIGLQGTVFVRFIIDITGTVTGVEVIRGVGGSLDKEAMRVIALMPKWKPGSQHGTPVNIRMILPIKFAMDKE